VDVLAVRPLSGRPLLQNLSSARLRLPQHATLLDLSGGGLRAEIGAAMGVREAAEMCDAFPTDTLIKVRLPFCTLSDTPMLARIRSVEKIAARGGLGIRLACEFLPMAPWEQEIIIHEVFLAQREQMRRRI
jgi:c-di-GMP-binding flagellar brake protein YcgR